MIIENFKYMPEPTPNFSAKPLTAKAKSRKKVVRRRPPVKKETMPSKREIDRQLESIYEDEGGKIPNMREIQKVKRGSPVLGFFFTVLVVGALVAGLAWAGFFLLPSADKFSESNINLEIIGPQFTALGATTTYTINYKNNDQTALTNAVLSVNYPEGFVFTASSISSSNAGHTEWTLDNINPSGEGSLAITGRSYGSLDQKFSWRIFLNYQPANFNSEMKKAATLETQIDRSPLKISISAPDKITTGQEVAITFKVSSNEPWPVNKLELEPLWPENFYLVSSSPKIQNNKWLISIITPTSSPAPTEFVFRVQGKFSENAEGLIPIKARLFLPLNEKQKRYQVAESEIKTELAKNILSFNLAINGSLKDLASQPGDTLNITLSFKNNNQTDLSKGTLKLILDAPALKRISLLNWKEINDKYDGAITGEQISDTARRGVMVWNSSKIPALAKIKAGQEITVDVRLPLKTGQGLSLPDLKEYKISATAEASFTDSTKAGQTVSSNPIIITVNSDLKFERRDEVSAKAGEAEEHAVKWVLTNGFHPLKNITLSADLYGDIKFETPTTPPAGTANYDESAKRFTWTIPDMPESVDVLALPFTVTLNKKNPTQNTLVSKVHVQAEDTITGQKLDFMGDEISLVAE